MPRKAVALSGEIELAFMRVQKIEMSWHSVSLESGVSDSTMKNLLNNQVGTPETQEKLMPWARRFNNSFDNKEFKAKIVNKAKRKQAKPTTMVRLYNKVDKGIKTEDLYIEAMNGRYFRFTKNKHKALAFAATEAIKLRDNMRTSYMKLQWEVI